MTFNVNIPELKCARAFPSFVFSSIVSLVARVCLKCAEFVMWSFVLRIMWARVSKYRFCRWVDDYCHRLLELHGVAVRWTTWWSVAGMKSRMSPPVRCYVTERLVDGCRVVLRKEFVDQSPWPFIQVSRRGSISTFTRTRLWRLFRWRWGMLGSFLFVAFPFSTCDCLSAL